jgi:hypothetical protein
MINKMESTENITDYPVADKGMLVRPWRITIFNT